MGMIRSAAKSMLWVLPFISFLMGYQLLRFISRVEIVQVPGIVGMHMHDAIKLLSAERLNVRILSERIDADAPEGMIISQTPAQGRMVKPHQSIFVILTRRPPKPLAPEFYGVTLNDAQQKAKENKITLKNFEIESVHPGGTIIAQNRLPNEILTDNRLEVIVSSGITPERIFPDLKGKRVSEVQAFFKSYNLQVEVNHPGAAEGHACTDCLITDQRPLAGAMIDLKKAPSIVLTVASKS